MQLPERALEGFDFALVIDLLPFRQLQGFEDFLHFIERAFQFVDDVVHLFDRPADAGRFADDFWFRRQVAFILSRGAGLFGLIRRNAFGRWGRARAGRPATFGMAASTATRPARSAGGWRLRLFGGRFRPFFWHHADNLPG